MYAKQKKQQKQKNPCPGNLKKLKILTHLKNETDIIDEIFVIILFFRSNIIKYQSHPRTARQ